MDFPLSEIDRILVKFPTQEERNKEFLEAAREGGIRTVNFYLEHKLADINYKTHFGFSSLMLSANHGHVPVVWALIQAGANVDSTNYFAQTPLLLAAQGGHDEVIEILVKAGAELLTEDGSGKTALRLACEYDHYKAALQLLTNMTEKNIDTKLHKHPFVDQYNKIQREIFYALWALDLSMEIESVKNMHLKEDNLMVTILMSLRPENYPLDLFKRAIDSAMTQVIKLKNLKKEKPQIEIPAFPAKEVVFSTVGNLHKQNKRQRKRSRPAPFQVFKKVSCKPG